MDSQTIEIIRLISSAATPILVLILGLMINNTLEKNKSVLIRETGFKNYWADKFLNISLDYTSAVSKCVTDLAVLIQIEKEKLFNWEEEFAIKEKELFWNIRKLQYLNWEIQNYMQFAPKSNQEVKEKEETLFRLLSELIKTKHGDLEEIRKIQFAFNNSVRKAHAEMLGIYV